MPTYRVNNLHEYDTIIQSGELVVVDFYADWCGPCQRIAPFVEQLSNHYPDINFIKVNCGQNNDIATAEGVTSMPTFYFFAGGELVANMVGTDQNKLHTIVDSLLDA